MSSDKQTSRTNAENSSSKDRGSESQTLALLQEIKSGSANPHSLCPVDRRLLVSLLTVEGQSTPEIAHLLKVSDRTVERDKQRIREERAITKDPKLLEQMGGRLISGAELSIQRIHKFQRDSDASPGVKIDGEHRCFQILSELIEKLQSLGFLPTATQRIEADFKHSAELSLSLDEIKSEVQRLQNIKTSLPSGKTKKVKSKTVKQKDKKS